MVSDIEYDIIRERRSGDTFLVLVHGDGPHNLFAYPHPSVATSGSRRVEVSASSLPKLVKGESPDTQTGRYTFLLGSEPSQCPKFNPRDPKEGEDDHRMTITLQPSSVYFELDEEDTETAECWGELKGFMKQIREKEGEGNFVLYSVSNFNAEPLSSKDRMITHKTEEKNLLRAVGDTIEATFVFLPSAGNKSKAASIRAAREDTAPIPDSTSAASSSQAGTSAVNERRKKPPIRLEGSGYGIRPIEDPGSWGQSPYDNEGAAMTKYPDEGSM